MAETPDLASQLLDAVRSASERTQATVLVGRLTGTEAADDEFWKLFDAASPMVLTRAFAASTRFIALMELRYPGLVEESEKWIDEMGSNPDAR